MMKYAGRVEIAEGPEMRQNGECRRSQGNSILSPAESAVRLDRGTCETDWGEKLIADRQSP